MPAKNLDIKKPALHDALKNAQQHQGALLATNFYNYETLRGILQAAAAADSSVILQLTKSSIDYMGLSVAVSMAHTAMKEMEIAGWLHLDHSDSYELIQRCLDAGFDSVMIDASEKPLAENIQLTKKVVQLAARYNAHVEAELGYVAKLGQSKDKTGFTEPAEAKFFVEETGVHALAIAIGTAHGFYKQAPDLDLERLSAIHKITRASLVLHGGSGIPDAVLREAIKRGICKINLATEIKNIFMLTLKECLMNNEEIDLRRVFPPAIQAVTKLVKQKLEIVKPITFP